MQVLLTFVVPGVLVLLASLTDLKTSSSIQINQPVTFGKGVAGVIAATVLVTLSILHFCGAIDISIH